MPAKKSAPKVTAKNAAAPAPAKKTPAKKAATPAAKKAATKKSSASYETIAHAAYLNYRRRMDLGLPGDHDTDWLEAERSLVK